MPLAFVQQDITTMHVDAIVNAANARLKNFAKHRGGGVCGAIFRAAGHNQMQNACDRIGGCEVGSAVITPGFALPAKNVIHAVGPIYKTGSTDEAIQLYNSYTSALFCAQECNARSVAFPLISSGIFGYPPYEALRIAVTAIEDFLQSMAACTDAAEPMDIYLSILDDELFHLAQTKREELVWPEIGEARARWIFEERRSTDRFEFRKSESKIFTDEEIATLHSLPLEEALAYRSKLLEQHLRGPSQQDL